MNISISKTMTVISGLIIIFALPAIADTEIPEEWVGVWELEIAAYDCDTNELLFSSTDVDTICSGSVFEDPDPSSITVVCTGSADATTFQIQCEGSMEPLPGCTVEFVYDGTGTRTNDSYMSTTITNITYTGGCPVGLDSCQRVEITGTRTSSSPGECGSTPVVSRAWGTVKSNYR